MSSELERDLREAREALPAPDESATKRARSRTLAALRPRRTRRTRTIVLVSAMLVTALLLGVTASSLNAPSVTAAREPSLLGFVPEPGWFALQSPPAVVAGQQTTAVAANVPFAADDVVNGLVEPSGLPYSTLLTLPPSGIVIVMTMTPEIEPHVAPVPVTPLYEERDLPLRLRDAVPLLQWGARLRPDEPLAQYQLRARLARQNVDVIVYFGVARPSAAQMRDAQRQLAALVVRGRQSAAVSPPVARALAPAAVIDRTYACETTMLGGIYEVRSSAHAGLPNGSSWSKLPFAIISSGGWAESPLASLPSAPANTLAWVTAGTPSASTTVGTEAGVFVVSTGGTMGVNEEFCRPTRAKVAFAKTGLRGGTTSRESVAFDCIAPRRLLVRLRATVDGSTALRERARVFLATNAPGRQAELVVRTPTGKLLAYASASRLGRAQLYTAKGCVRQ